MTPEELRKARAGLLSRPGLAPAALRTELVALVDGWLAQLFGAGAEGVALVALGGYGRREPAPGSDLDLLLVHHRGTDPAGLAQRLWYAVWDAGLPLDHAVRTISQARLVASADLRVALGLLDARHVAGDVALTTALRAQLTTDWRHGARRRVPELLAATTARWRAAGELAFLVEPDLKSARGGLRDVLVLRALAATWLVDRPAPPVRAAARRVLDARTALHLGSGRPTDRLVRDAAPRVAAALGCADADALRAVLAEAARTIAYAVDVAARQASAALAPRRRGGLSPRRAPARRPLGDGVVEHDGEAVLARGVEPAADPGLPLRVAAGAARAGLPIGPATLARLAAECPALPDPWPRTARDALLALLGAGTTAVPVVEALDQAGLWGRALPEWSRVRNLPPRSLTHTFTVDRHLIEAAAAAALLVRRVSRPDLLLVAALLHDVGKGPPFEADHSVTGAALAERTAARLGYDAADAAVVGHLVRHHLLLPVTALHRDLDDPTTVDTVTSAVGDRAMLDLLHALSEADGRATGPGAWTDWRAGLVADLVRRVASRLDGRPSPPPAPLSAAQRALIDVGRVDVLVESDRVTVVAPRRIGLLAVTAGVLALHRLEVRAADVRQVDGCTVAVFRVSPRFGTPPDSVLVRSELRRALAGELDVSARLAAYESAYPPATSVATDEGVPGEVLLAPDAATDAAVVEVRAADSPGLLHRLAAAVAGCDLDVRAARIVSLGAEAVDVFYLVTPTGGRPGESAVAAAAARLRDACLPVAG